MKTINLINKPVIKQNKNFDTILIKLSYPFYLEEKDVGKSNILASLLTQRCESLNEEEFENYKKDNYIINFSSSVNIWGKSGFLNFYLEFVNPYITKEDNIKKCLDLLYNSLYKPHLINNIFAKKDLEIIKKNIILYNINNKKSLKGYLNNKIPPLIDDKNNMTLRTSYHIDKIKKYTSNDLYLYYLDVIKTKTPFIFCLGNVKDFKLDKLLISYFNKNNNLTNSYIKDYYSFLKIKKESEITEVKEFNQSALAMVYKIDNMNQKDIYLLKIIEKILHPSSGGILFEQLRTKQGLVYSFDSFVSMPNGILQINIYTDKDKLELAKNTIINTINSLKEEKNIKELLPSIKNRLNISLIRRKDNNYSLIDNLTNQLFKCKNDSKIILKKLDFYSLEEICNFIKRLKLDLCFYIKGEKK